MQRAGDVDAARSDNGCQSNDHSSRFSRAWHFLRRHFLTFVLTAIVGAGLVMAQAKDHHAIFVGNSHMSYTTHSYGWPINALSRTVAEDYRSPWHDPQAPVQRIVTYEWRLHSAAINTIVSLLLVASTVICGELFMRRRSARFQLSLIHVLSATLIVAILLVYHEHEFDIYWWWGAGLYSHHGLRGFPWYTTYSLYLGMACGLAVALTGITAGILRMRR